LLIAAGCGFRRQRDADRADEPLRIEDIVDPAEEIGGHSLGDQARAEASAGRWHDAWPATLHPQDHKLLGLNLLTDVPAKPHAATRHGERAVLRGIGDEFVDDHPQAKGLL